MKVATTWVELATRQMSGVDFFSTLIKDPNIRVKQSLDGTWWFSVIDFINYVCGKDERSSYARVTWKRLISENFDDLMQHCEVLKFSGAMPTPCATMPGLSRIMIKLYDTILPKYRKIYTDVMDRISMGDETIVEEIQANAASNGPVQKAFRHGLKLQKIAQRNKDIQQHADLFLNSLQPPKTVLGKRKTSEDLLDRKNELRRLDNKIRITQLNACKLKSIAQLVQSLNENDKNWKDDTDFVNLMKKETLACIGMKVFL